jgi:hypothetical protein
VGDLIANDLITYLEPIRVMEHKNKVNFSWSEDWEEVVEIKINGKEVDVEQFLEWVADSKTSDRRMVAEDIWQIAEGSDGIKVLIRLAFDESTSVRAAVAFNRHTPPEVLAELAKDSRDEVRFQLAYNPNCSEETLNILAKDQSRMVREQLLFNPKLPIAAILTLIKDSDAEIVSRTEKFIASWYSNEEGLDQLANLEEPNIWKSVAANKHTSARTLKRLYDLSQNKPAFLNDLRLALASNEKTQEELLFKLAGDPWVPVRVAVAENQATPLTTLALLVVDNSEYVRIKVAKRKLTHELYLKLAKDSRADIKAKLAGNINIPKDIIEILSKEMSVMVHRALLSNPNTPDSIKKNLIV